MYSPLLTVAPLPAAAASAGGALVLLYLVGTAAMAAWTFYDAFGWEEKSDSPALWAGVVLMLSLPGLFLYLLLGREESFGGRPPRRGRR
ncbi:hypothetical protein [Natronorarus salvus]|uniref:hypothetical protein n=1 Tax=Natronorarus salvus TaxID=3117733 RepID=UPI002F2666F6